MTTQPPVGTPLPSSARALFDALAETKAQIEQIQRYCEKHNLGQNHAVFVLASMLKADSDLASIMLDSLTVVGETIDSASAAAVAHDRAAVSLTHRLIAQIEAAASRVAGQLDLAAANFERQINNAAEMSGDLTIAIREYRETRTVLKNLLGAEDARSALAAIIGDTIKVGRDETIRAAQSMLWSIDVRTCPPAKGIWAATIVNTLLLITVLYSLHR